MHALSLLAVWLTVASGAVVFTEPAPVDALTIGLVILLPVVGLARITPPLLLYLCLWLLVMAGGYIASIASDELGVAVTHTSISLYLALASFIIAAFVAQNPKAHTALILHAYLWAGMIASTLALIGYFDLLPYAGELFTKFGRASGTFKDPNVFGPFLIPPLLYAVHLVTTRRFSGTLLPLVGCVVLTLAILLSFSRGAWLALAIAGLLYGFCAFITAPTNRQRLKLLTLALIGLVGALAILVMALQVDKVSELMEQRASLSQSYDEGPEGRFGGQAKAVGLILDHPFGIGAMAFSQRFHNEAPHNVYLAMFLNAGWFGGLAHLLLIILTLSLGWRHVFKRHPSQPLYLVAFASLVAMMVEGAVIDTDHWRHFYLLMGLCWGLMMGARGGPARQPRASTINRRAMIIDPQLVIPRRPRKHLRRPPRLVARTPGRKPRRPVQMRPVPRRNLQRHARRNPRLIVARRQRR